VCVLLFRWGGAARFFCVKRGKQMRRPNIFFRRNSRLMADPDVADLLVWARKQGIIVHPALAVRGRSITAKEDVGPESEWERGRGG